MWDKMLESLQGIEQPKPQMPQKGAKKPDTMPQAVSRDCERLIMQAIREHNTCTVMELRTLLPPNVPDYMLSNALQRLCKRGELTLVKAKPYYKAKE